MPETKDKIDNASVDALEVIKGLNHGDVAFELSNKLQELVAKVIELKDGGSLTLKIKIAPEKIGNSSIRFTADVSSNLPKPEPKSDIRFGTESGIIMKDDPLQRQFGFMDKYKEGKE